MLRHCIYLPTRRYQPITHLRKIWGKLKELQAVVEFESIDPIANHLLTQIIYTQSRTDGELDLQKTIYYEYSYNKLRQQGYCVSHFISNHKLFLISEMTWQWCLDAQSGCSTFLKTLTNQQGEYHFVEGEVHYDLLSPDEIAKHYHGDVTYCPEDDGQSNLFSFSPAQS